MAFRHHRLGSKVRVGILRIGFISDGSLPIPYPIFMGIRIREFGGSDVEQLAKLRLLVGGGTLADLEARFLNELNLKDRKIFCSINSQDLIVGYGRVQEHHIETLDFYSTVGSLPLGWYLRGCIVHPDSRRKNIATLLTEARLNYLKSKSIEKTYCFLDSDEKIQLPLYLSKNFKILKEDIQIEYSSDKGTLLLKQE